jgi:bifunctional UDP-N-acetylglucosamine pyrophosphorylase/glucosamine-1-phosphate N-acetyltransferase
VLLPVANKPILEHVLVNAKNAGLKEFLVIVSFKKDAVVNYFQDGKKWGVKIDYIDQREPMGTAHAIGSVEEFVGDTFVVLSGDTLIGSSDIKKMVKSNHLAMGIKKYDKVEDYGTVEIKDTKVTKIREKSKTAGDSYINVGVYRLTSSIFDAIQKTSLSQRQEFELTDSLQMLIDTGEDIDAVVVDEWMDAGRPWDLLSLNEYLLKTITDDIQGEIEEHVYVKGKLVLGKHSRILSGTYLEGNVIIGENAKIGPNCYIRPYTSIGDNCHIGNACEVKNSIIMSNTKVPHQNYVGDSIIGEQCNLGAGTKIANLRLDKKPIYTTIDGKRIQTGRRKFGAVIGDHVQTGINVTINVGTSIGNGCFIGQGAVVDGEIAAESRIL